MNLYQYVGGNPILYVDPMGETSVRWEVRKRELERRMNAIEASTESRLLNELVQAISLDSVDFAMKSNFATLITAGKTIADISSTLNDSNLNKIEKAKIATAQVGGTAVSIVMGIGGSGTALSLSGGNPYAGYIGFLIGSSITATAVGEDIQCLKKRYYNN